MAYEEDDDDENDDDLPPPSAYELRWEEERVATLRTFEVTLSATLGHIEHLVVVAHSWGTEQGGAMLCFYTVQRSSRTLIHDAIGARFVVRVREITTPNEAATIDRIFRKMMIREASEKAFGAMKKSSRETH